MIKRIKKFFNKKYDIDYFVESDRYDWVNQNGEYVNLPYNYLYHSIAQFFIQGYHNNLKFFYPIYERILHPLIKLHINYSVKKLKLIPSEEYGCN